MLLLLPQIIIDFGTRFLMWPVNAVVAYGNFRQALKKDANEFYCYFLQGFSCVENVVCETKIFQFSYAFFLRFHCSLIYLAEPTETNPSNSDDLPFF